MAPSPTGGFHIGSMRTLLYNYALARKTGGQFILRIEDTDRERFVEGATEQLIQVIKDCGLSWDEGPEVGGPYAPYVQSQRLSIYKEHAKQLIASGRAYYCFCSKDRLEQQRNEQTARGKSTKYDKRCLGLFDSEIQKNLKSGAPYVIRLNVPPDEDVSFEDRALGRVSFPTNDIDDQVLLKSDGFPTYHLAVVVDDHLMKIDFVMRGVEWLPSTPKHILLYKAFGWEIPAYAHIPLLKEKGGTKKLSKRVGSVSTSEFLAEGYLPEAILNFLMFLGWNPGTEKEIYSLEEFVDDFSVEKIHKTDLVVFDRDKLKWINGRYIRGLSEDEFLERVGGWLKNYGASLYPEGTDSEYVKRVLSLVKERVKFLAELPSLTGYFFYEPEPPKFPAHTEKDILIKVLETLNSHDWDSLQSALENFIESANLTPKEVFMAIRIAVSGSTVTPPIFDTLYVLGRERVVERIEAALESL